MTMEDLRSNVDFANLRKEFNMLERDTKAQSKQIKKLMEDVERQRRQIKALNDQIESLKKGKV